jgi:acetyl esterase/lipase
MRRVSSISRFRSIGTLALTALTVCALAACTTADSGAVPAANPTVNAAYPELKQYPEVTVERDVSYRTIDGQTMKVDVCLPDGEANAPRASIVSIHGGSWRSGSKSGIYWLSVCQWLASEGYVAFSVDYRLAPQHPFPAAITDLRAAVRWVRSARTVDRYDLDPARVGAFGGSAGGNLAALLGTEGEGPLTTGSRVSAVAELSGPSDLTREGTELGGIDPTFEEVELDYLGCEDWTGCEHGRDASPIYQIDRTDPPFFIGHSVDERIPLAQSRALASLLRVNDVPVTLVSPEGTAHSIAMLDDAMREQIIEFYRENLGP